MTTRRDTHDQHRTTALLHDGSRIDVRVVGSGPHVLLPVRPEPHDPQTAAGMRAWGADPDYGPTLAAGLADRFTVITADYEGHRMSVPAARTLTPEHVAADLLAIADAGGADRFAAYGYSWLALSALQLALRTDRLTALAMGGFPPVDGPYEAMRTVTRVAHAHSLTHSLGQADAPVAEAAGADETTPGDWEGAVVRTSVDQTQQFVTLYEALEGFDDAVASARITVPRLAFAGARDAIDYGPTWGDVRVEIADPLRRHRTALRRAGWTVELLPGLDHMTAMHGDVVLSVLRPWLAGALSRDAGDPAASGRRGGAAPGAPA